mgnify:CR=1 FL=1
MAMTMLQAALLWQVYDLSGSALQLGMLGLVRFLPSLGLSLVAGSIADSYDRRLIAIVSQVAPTACAIILMTTTLAGAVSLPLIYGLVLVIALASAFENPARQALLPSIVTPETFANAITVSSTVQQLGFVSGPAMAGLLIAVSGVAAAYAAYAGLIAASIISLALIRPRARDWPSRKVSVEAIREGISFVWGRQVILGSMTLDMFAVIFGGATALLPIYAKDILGVGAVGYGLLAASLDVGALVMSVALVVLPPVRNTGRTLLVAVAVFALATTLFGISRSFPMSLAAYMLVGMSDQVSVVMRNTTVQLSTPDELRGRVSSVNMLFIGASNQLGAVESGFVAAVTSATFAVVSGGIGCLAVVGVVTARMPELRRYRIARPEPDATRVAEPVAAGGSQ